MIERVVTQNLPGPRPNTTHTVCRSPGLIVVLPQSRPADDRPEWPTRWPT